MKLYLLNERNDNEHKTTIGDYETFVGFVVRAKDERAARTLAVIGSGDDDWMNPEIVSCIEIKKTGDQEIILDSYNAG
jgi:hypothetical protein